MADREAGPTSPSSSAGGTDTEPLRGGMREVDREAGSQGGPEAPGRRVYPGEEHERETGARKEPPRETLEEKDPPAPYHGDAIPAGGLSPRAMPGEGTAPQQPSPGELEATAGRKIPQERHEVENEGANAPRRDPARRGVDE